MSLLNMRQGQRRFLRLVDEHRLLAFVARRQYGKTTTFAKVAIKKMMKQRDQTVIFGSAKLTLSREIVRKESEILRAAIADVAGVGSNRSARLQVVDAGTSKAPDAFTADDFAEMFEAQRLEWRFYHTPSSYSRTKVVALREDTVGETGHLMCDEVTRISNWRDVWEAVKPIISSNPEFRVVICGTPPPDDAHYSFSQLAPPVGEVFTPNPAGNIYHSQGGITVLRVSAADAFLDGVPIYDDDTGAPLDPTEARRRDPDKEAFDRNFNCLFIAGGTAACGLNALSVAQTRGIGQCLFVLVQDESDLDKAISFLVEHLGPGRVGIGYDVATTTGGVSNPSSITVLEEAGFEFKARLIVAWKTADPAIAEERVRRIVRAVAHRKAGGRARGLAVDGTNERYFAVGLQRSLMGDIPVTIVVGSETTELPGGQKLTMKQYTGNLLIADLDDNHLTLPPEGYVRDDFRLERKEKGVLVCEPDLDGKHGDTFDSTKLARYALDAGGPVEAQAVRTCDSGAGLSREWQPTSSLTV